MVSYADLDPDAPFAVVFSSRGMDWAAKLVAVGALFGGCDGVHGGVSRREQACVFMPVWQVWKLSCKMQLSIMLECLENNNVKLVAVGDLLGECDAGRGWEGECEQVEHFAGVGGKHARS